MNDSAPFLAKVRRINFVPSQTMTNVNIDDLT